MSIEPSQAEHLAWQEAVIEKIEPLTPHMKSFFFRLPRRPERHFAGQHVDVRLTAPDGYTAERSYSIASAPNAPLIELAIERVDDGEVSSFFHEIAEAGDTITMRGPIGGHFIWRPAYGGPLLLAAGGSGIAPLMAMLRARRMAGSEAPALLLYSARSLEELAYGDELLAMEAEDRRLRVVRAITRGPGGRPSDYQRRFDEAAVEDILRSWEMRPAHAYVCGSNGFVSALSGALVLQGVSPSAIKTERFGGAE